LSILNKLRNEDYMPIFALAKATLENVDLGRSLVCYHATICSESKEKAVEIFEEKHPHVEHETELSVIEIEEK